MNRLTAVLAATLCAHSWADSPDAPGFSTAAQGAWMATGVDRDDRRIESNAPLSLEAGAQISRLFPARSRVTAAVEMRPIFSDLPSDTVQLQVGAVGLVFVREGTKGILLLFAGQDTLRRLPIEFELDEHAQSIEPISAELGYSAELGVVEIEVSGRSFAYATDAQWTQPVEVALSAGSGHGLHVTGIVAWSSTEEVAVSDAGTSSARGSARQPSDVTLASSRSAAEAHGDSRSASEVGITGSPGGATRVDPAARPPAVSTLEVFTPSAVPRGRPPGTPADSRSHPTKSNSSEPEALQ